MSNKIESLLKQISDAANNVIGLIQEVDAKIDDLSARRKALVEAPIGRRDFLAYIDRWIDNKTQRFSTSTKNELSKVDRRFIAVEQGLGSLDLLTGGISLPVAITEEGLLWYLKPAIIARMEEITAGVDFQTGEDDIPAEKRRELIAAIDMEISKMRSERNELATQLMKTGVRA